MRWLAHELVIALLAVLAIALAYIVLAQDGRPRPSGPIGYTFGIVGFFLMLCTETLYTLRKRSKRFTYGRMSFWLKAHIVSGIVGPSLALLHTAGKFHGLAGMLALFTVVIVASGFIGRYIFTAVPRSLEDAGATIRDLETRMVAVNRELQAMGVEHLGGMVVRRAENLPQSGWKIVLGRPYYRWRMRRQLSHLIRESRGRGRTQARHLVNLAVDRYRLRLQVESLAAARRLMALWHIVHIPIGGALFALAFLHIGGALYYAAFLKW